MSLHFGEFELDQERRQLLSEGQPVPLEPKAYELLCLLVERRPRALSRAQIRDVVWPGVFISESTLSQAVTTLRQALGDDARQARYIRTAHGFGYAFCGEARDSTDGRRREETDEAEESPYPGLAAFTEEDAELFYGREKEVSALWERIRRQPLLAVIGPSGAGKSSFVRAGIAARSPEGWTTLVCTPGSSPRRSLGRALAARMESDPETVQAFVDFEDPEVALQLFSRWRAHNAEALVVVDQLEELFTLCPPEVQAGFATVLGRLAGEGRVHVLLSLRDDFLIRCHEQPALGPVFQDLTPLLPLSGAALRRALEEPARRQGYGFEDEALAEEMVEAAEGARTPLPLLAFAVSRLWEKRDRERKLLTRAAYAEIGGVAGALAQHAEQTLGQIGPEREPIVRELFRNLVTAQGTRAARTREELLSVFDASNPGDGAPAGMRAEAGAVLQALVGARLLTAYERATEAGEGEPPEQQVEITHESLLGTWPRLVRWQTQDADGAQLRDQLRQAAQAWQDRGQSEDLLWSGTAYRDLSLWRERYTGGLTAAEQAFADAAARHVGRQRRRRRLAGATLLAAAATVATVTSLLWQKSETEVRQRKAAELLALGRVLLDDYPTGALAHAIASLERADNVPARRFAVEALWRGPTAHVLTDPVSPGGVRWSPDGRWLAVDGFAALAVLDRDTGDRHQLTTTSERTIGFSSDSSRLLTQAHGRDSLHLWSLPEVEPLEIASPPNLDRTTVYLINRRMLFFESGGPEDPDRPVIVREGSIDGGPTRTVGRWRRRPGSNWHIDPAGEWLTWLQDGLILRQRLDALAAPAEVLGRHDGDVNVWSKTWSDRIVTGDATGEVRIWTTATGQIDRTLRSPAGARRIALDPRSRYVATAPGLSLPRDAFSLFDLTAPRAADRIPLVQNNDPSITSMAFHPRGQQLASAHNGTAILWNLRGRRSTVLQGPAGASIAVKFTGDARLLSSSQDGVVWLWNLNPQEREPVRELWAEKGAHLSQGVESDPQDRFALVSTALQGRIAVIPLDGGPARVFSLERVRRPPGTSAPSVDPSGQRVALFYGELGNPAAGSIRILDLTTGDERRLIPPEGGGACNQEVEAWAANVPAWLPNGRLVSVGAAGLRLWDLSTASSRQLRPCGSGDELRRMAVRSTPDSRSLVILGFAGARNDKTSGLAVFDLETEVSRDLTSHGARLLTHALDPTGRILITGGADGIVRAGPLSGEEPHLLYGHTRAINSVAVSPDGRWIASGDMDGAIRLWPMPEGPPLHTLPYDELLTRLRSLTNVRVAPDPTSATGYSLKSDPFPGWAEVPEW